MYLYFTDVINGCSYRHQKLSGGGQHRSKQRNFAEVVAVKTIKTKRDKNVILSTWHDIILTYGYHAS